MQGNVAPAGPEHGLRRRWANRLRRVLPLAFGGLLGLGGLILVSAQIEHCVQDAHFCPADDHLVQSPALLEETLEATAAPPPDPKVPEHTTALAEGLRPVLAHAYDPLPLSMDSEAGRVFVLPPGRSTQDMATERGAISVDEITLIAVVHQNGTRHALVRLPDGRILRLVQGDALDEGTVAAISDDALYFLGPDLVPRAFVLGG